MNTDSTSQPAFVYFIAAGATPIKIGLSNDPKGRMQELQTAHYKRLRMLFTIRCHSREQAFELERAFHRWYEERRLMNEWFNVTPQEIADDLHLLTALAQGIDTVAYVDADGLLAMNKRATAPKRGARAMVNQYLTENPDMAEAPVRQLAELIGVSKSLVADELRTWRTQNSEGVQDA